MRRKSSSRLPPLTSKYRLLHDLTSGTGSAVLRIYRNCLLFAGFRREFRRTFPVLLVFTEENEVVATLTKNLFQSRHIEFLGCIDEGISRLLRSLKPFCTNTGGGRRRFQCKLLRNDVRGHQKTGARNNAQRPEKPG